LLKAGLEAFVKEHPEGLELKLEENGKNLSGGQRQRISIARAILRNTSILFSDEATASLNQELGKAVENTLLSLDQTIVAISHRVYEGVTERYDFVLEMKNGTLIEYPGSVYFKEALA
jgi:ABC-type bacteriocin/lantibiotic exporter with double-glycine peptidase domain